MTVHAVLTVLACVVGSQRACISISLSQKQGLEWLEVEEGQPCLRGSRIEGRLQGSLG